MTHLPTLVQFVLLGLGTFRLVRLVAYDEITVNARTILTQISDSAYKQAAGYIEQCKAAGDDPWADNDTGRALRSIISPRQYYIAKLVRCPWCIGWWLSVLVWIAWSAEPRVTLWLTVPFAVSAIVGLVAKNLDP